MGGWNVFYFEGTYFNGDGTHYDFNSKDNSQSLFAANENTFHPK